MNGNSKKNAALDALGKVKEAEERARTIIREARIVSARILKNASEEAEVIKQDHFARAKNAAEARKKVVIDEALKEAEKTRSQAEAEAASIRQKAAASMAEAVEKVTRRIKEFLEGGSV